MFWKRKKKQPVKPARSVEENMAYMASIGMSPSALMQYETLCKDIEAATKKQTE